MPTKKRNKTLSFLICVIALLTVLLLGYGESLLPVASPPVNVEVGPHVAVITPDNGAATSFTDYELGLQAARELGKPILISFTTPSCPYSHQLLTRTFFERDVRKIWSRFIHIQINSEQRPDLCKHYEVIGYPTVQILSSTGTQLKRLEGEDALAADLLAFQMQIAANSQATRTTSTTSESQPK